MRLTLLNTLVLITFNVICYDAFAQNDKEIDFILSGGGTFLPDSNSFNADTLNMPFGYTLGFGFAFRNWNKYHFLVEANSLRHGGFTFKASELKINTLDLTGEFGYYYQRKRDRNFPKYISIGGGVSNTGFPFLNSGDALFGDFDSRIYKLGFGNGITYFGATYYHNNDLDGFTLTAKIKLFQDMRFISKKKQPKPTIKPSIPPPPPTDKNQKEIAREKKKKKQPEKKQISTATQLICNSTSRALINLKTEDGKKEAELTLPITFSWRSNDVKDLPKKYRLVIWENGKEAKNGNVFETKQINIDVDNLIAGTEYNWKVEAIFSDCKAVSESNSFKTVKLSDLQVENLQISPGMSGQSVEINYNIVNTGKAKTEGDIWFDYVWYSPNLNAGGADSRLIKKVKNKKTLNPGESYSNTLTYPLPDCEGKPFQILVLTDTKQGEAAPDSTKSRLKRSRLFGTNNIKELNELNNIAWETSKVIEPKTADFEIDNFGGAFDVLLSGHNVNINWTVKNKGDAANEPLSRTDEVFMADNPNFQNAKKVISYVSNSVLKEVDGEEQVASEFFVPRKTKGKYYFKVVTNADQNICEINKLKNNEKIIGPFEVKLKPTANLNIENIEIISTKITDFKLNLNYNISNKGAIDTEVSKWEDAVYIDKTPNAKRPAYRLKKINHSGVLARGADYEVKDEFSIPSNLCGEYYVYVKTDIRDQVFEDEAYELNQLVAVDKINIVPPDLTIENVKITEEDIKSGSDINIGWTIRNTGEGDFSESLKSVVYLSSTPNFSEDTKLFYDSKYKRANFRQGDSLNISAMIHIPIELTGEYYVIVNTSTYLNELCENKSNNIKVSEPIKIKLAPQPDLIVDEVVAPIEVIEEERFNFSYTISNIGTGAALENTWYDQFYLSPTPTFNTKTAIHLNSRRTTPPLQSDTSYTRKVKLKLPYRVSAGEYHLIVKTDAGDKIFEQGNENNNENFTPVSVKSKPIIDPIDYDLIAESIVYPNQIRSGQKITIQANIGLKKDDTRSVRSNWADYLYLSKDKEVSDDDILIDYKRYNYRPFNDDYTFSTNYQMPREAKGDYYVILYTDRYKKSIETNENNNIKVSPQINIEYVEPADLEVSNLSAPEKGLSGEPFKINYSVTNIGKGKTESIVWADKVYLSKDAVIDKYDKVMATSALKKELLPNNNYENEVTVTLPHELGNFYLLLKTDATNKIYEPGAKANNESKALIDISRPDPCDLVIDEIRFPEKVNNDDAFRFSMKIKNIGDNKVNGKMKDMVYFSRDNKWDLTDIPIREFDRLVNLDAGMALGTYYTETLPYTVAGNYYLLGKTDVYDNIYEVSDSNNFYNSLSQIHINVPKLELNGKVNFTTKDEEPKVYKLEVPASANNESVLIKLSSAQQTAINEMYVRKGEVPTRTEYDFAYNTPFSPNQEIVIPYLEEGNWYVMIFADSKEFGIRQNLNLTSEMLEFEIRNIDVNNGGNTGLVTTKIEGAKFTENMEVFLKQRKSQIPAANITWVNPTTIYATFDLQGKELGTYDVILTEKVREETIKQADAFTIEGGLPVKLRKEYIHQQFTRRNQQVPFILKVTNRANTDVDLSQTTLESMEGDPIAFEVENLSGENNNLSINFEEHKSLKNILRPGQTATIKAYVQAPDFVGRSIKLIYK